MCEFEKLDGDYFKAYEKDDKKEMARVSKRKQYLRDIPAHPDIDKAATVEELKAIIIKPWGQEEV
jgi:hypothetical protein